MYEVWKTGDPAARLAGAETFSGAELALDAACQERHAAAEASGQAVREEFEIRQDGRAVAWLTWTPETGRPYESITLNLGEPS